MPYRPTAHTEARRIENRRKILAAAEDKVLSAGFSGLSVNGVAADAGVAVGTVYRHFSSKAELCTELFRQASQREVDRVHETAQGSGSPAARLLRVARTFVGRAIRGRRLAWALIAEPLDPILEQERLVFRRAYARIFQALLQDGIRHGDFHPCHTEVAAHALVGALAEMLVEPLAPDSAHISGEEQQLLINEASQFCLRAVGYERKMS